MRKRARAERVPPERRETLRQAIRAFLEGPPATARDISAAVRLPEKEVAGHLEHLARSLSRQGAALVIAPAECGACGFVFRKRGRLRTPSHCPVCRGESMHPPRFSVRGLTDPRSRRAGGVPAPAAGDEPLAERLEEEGEVDGPPVAER